MSLVGSGSPVSGEAAPLVTDDSTDGAQGCNYCSNWPTYILSTTPAALSFCFGIYSAIDDCSEGSKALDVALVVVACVAGVFSSISSCCFCCRNAGEGTMIKGAGFVMGMVGFGTSIAGAVRLGGC